MVGPAVEVAQLPDAGPHDTGPDVDNVILDAAVVPGEAAVVARWDRHAWRGAVRRARKEEIIRVAEERKRRRASRVGGDHVQRLLLHRVGKGHGHGGGATRVWIDGREPAALALQPAHDRVGRGRMAGDVDGRPRIRVNRERGGVGELRGKKAAQVRVDLTDAVVRAGDRDAVAPGVRGRVAHEMIALVDGEHEQCIVLCNPAHREPLEERLERAIIVAQLLHVAGLAWRVREVGVAGGAVAVMRV